MTSILRPLTPPPALMASTAKITPRLKPMVGAELGPVIAARKPILIGSDWAIAGFGNENVAAPSAPALPNKTSRRETAMSSSPVQLDARRYRERSLQPFSAYRRNLVWSVKFEPDAGALSRVSGQQV